MTLVTLQLKPASQGLHVRLEGSGLDHGGSVHLALEAVHTLIEHRCENPRYLAEEFHIRSAPRASRSWMFNAEHQTLSQTKVCNLDSSVEELDPVHGVYGSLTLVNPVPITVLGILWDPCAVMCPSPNQCESNTRALPKAPQPILPASGILRFCGSDLRAEMLLKLCSANAIIGLFCD